MTRLAKIERDVSALSDSELKEFAAWFDTLKWERWDRQLEADVAAGRLDSLVASARAEIALGKIKPL